MGTPRKLLVGTCPRHRRAVMRLAESITSLARNGEGGGLIEVIDQQICFACFYSNLLSANLCRSTNMQGDRHFGGGQSGI